MMAKASKRYAAPFTLLLLAAQPLAVWAQDDDPFALEGVEEEDLQEQPVIENEISVGLYWLDDDALQFGKYTGLTEDGAELLLDFRLDERPQWDSGDVRRWSLEGWRLGLDSRRIEYTIADQGTQRFEASYSEIPNYRIGDGLTPYRAAEPGLFLLPNDWQVEPGSSNTSGFLNLQESLMNVEVDTKRERLEAAYSRQLARNWDMTLEYRHETKKGSRTIGAIFGSNGGNPRGAILPAPVDYTYDIIELSFDFTGNRVQGGVGTYLSFFGNDQTSLTWQNPYGQLSRWADGVAYPDSYGRLALEPDNEFLQVRGWIGFNLTPGSRLTADVSLGESTQNDAFFPYTINPILLVTTPLPRASLDGEIDTTFANLRYTAQLARRMSLAVNYRYDDRDNKTPRAPYPYIGGDSQDQRPFEDARINLPYSHTKHEADAKLSFRLGSGMKLKVGAEYADISRTYQEVTDSDEWTWLAGFRARGWESTSFSVDWRHSERDIDEYIGNTPLIFSHLPGTIEEDDFENHPLLRKYFLTSRDRDELRGRVDFYPMESLNLGLSAMFWEDDYEEGFFGLNEAEATSLSLDAGWYPVERIAITAYYTREEYEAFQTSRSFRPGPGYLDPDNDWNAETEDDVDTWNVSLSWTGSGPDDGPGRLTAGFDYTVSDVKSVITVQNVANDTEPLPPLVTDMSSVSAWVDFGVSPKSSINLSVQWNELDVRDFGLDNVVPDTLSNVLTLGESAGSYDVVMLWGSWTARF